MSNRAKFEMARNELDEAFRKIQDTLDLMQEIRDEKKVSAEYEELVRTRTVLEALRKRPYEFYVCASVRNSISQSHLVMTSFTLEEDAKAWCDYEYKHFNAVQRGYEKQTLPLPDVEKMRSLLRRSHEIIGTLKARWGFDEDRNDGERLREEIEEVLNDE